MKIVRSSIALLLLSATSVLAESPSEGFTVAKMTFESIDADGDGLLSPNEMTMFGESIFLGMDYDKNSQVAFDEFEEWDIGFGTAAEAEGGADAMKIANRILFGFWDRDKDGAITMDEFNEAGAFDFERADVNGDQMLNPREYLLGYSVNIVMRGAIRPDIDVSAR
ncbi:MAG: hypothetical protein AAFY99_03230 [Pseudomonadota bacterium]